MPLMKIIKYSNGKIIKWLLQIKKFVVATFILNT